MLFGSVHGVLALLWQAMHHKIMVMPSASFDHNTATKRLQIKQKKKRTRMTTIKIFGRNTMTTSKIIGRNVSPVKLWLLQVGSESKRLTIDRCHFLFNISLMLLNCPDFS